MTKIIGLTGMSGAGKGAICGLFASHGIPAVDTDAVYHELLLQKNEMTHELALAFGKEILNEQGLVDRRKLSNLIFTHENTPSALHTLNGITHKYIMAKTREIVQAHEKAGVPAVLIDAPQLFEAGVERECDLVLGIVAPYAICIERIMKRDGIAEQAAKKRLLSQHDADYFAAHCDEVIVNDGDLDALHRAVCQFICKYGVK